MNLIGFDDAPFSPEHRGNVALVGTVFAGSRLDGVLLTQVRRDGANSTQRMADVIRGSRYHRHLQGVLLQGIAVAGFNVVDIHRLSALVELPVVVVARRKPRMIAIRRALEENVPGGARKWRLIQQAGALEPLSGVFVQRAGIEAPEVERWFHSCRIHGSLPEPLRVAHLIAGALTTGHSRGRA